MYIFDTQFEFDALTDDRADEPDVDDAVKCCPDCERPNQFGNLCDSCRREHEAEIGTDFDDNDYLQDNGRYF